MMCYARLKNTFWPGHDSLLSQYLPHPQGGSSLSLARMLTMKMIFG